MQRTAFIYLNITILLSFLATAGHAGPDPYTLLNPEMAKHVAGLKATGKHSVEDFNACQITSAVQELVSTDPHSSFIPFEITLYYEDNEIIKLINSRGKKGKELKGLNLNCVEFNQYIYLFFDTMSFEGRLKFNLSDLAYVIYSADHGRTWSSLKGLSPLSKKTKFVIPHERFSQNLRFLGDTKGHAISIYNIQDDTTYLLDPDFNILRTVSVYNRLSGFDEPADFNYYNGRIYLTRGSCETKKGSISCPGFSYEETSNDYGKTWKKKIIPYITASQFLTYNESLYNFSLSPCSSSWWKFVPALDKTNICGKLTIKKLNKIGEWGKPKILLKRVNKLISIYPEKSPLIVWQDLRFHKQRKCGFIPIVGCIDSGSFEGPHTIFAGRLNMDTLTLDESLIHYDQKIQYFK